MSYGLPGGVNTAFAPPICYSLPHQASSSINVQMREETGCDLQSFFSHVAIFNAESSIKHMNCLTFGANLCSCKRSLDTALTLPEPDVGATCSNQRTRSCCTSHASITC